MRRAVISPPSNSPSPHLSTMLEPLSSDLSLRPLFPGLQPDLNGQPSAAVSLFLCGLSDPFAPFLFKNESLWCGYYNGALAYNFPSVLTTHVPRYHNRPSPATLFQVSPRPSPRPFISLSCLTNPEGPPKCPPRFLGLFLFTAIWTNHSFYHPTMRCNNPSQAGYPLPTCLENAGGTPPRPKPTKPT